MINSILNMNLKQENNIWITVQVLDYKQKFDVLNIKRARSRLFDIGVNN